VKRRGSAAWTPEVHEGAGEGRGGRYLRLGPGQLPEIYPGTLEGLEAAKGDALLASSHDDGVHSVHSCSPGESVLVRAYEAGQLTWAPGIERGA